MKIKGRAINFIPVTNAEIELSIESLAEQLTMEEIIELMSYETKDMKSKPTQKECSCKEPNRDTDYNNGKYCSHCGLPIPKENFPKQFPISACCNTSVRTIEDLDKKIYYVCQACNSPCNLAEWNKPEEIIHETSGCPGRNRHEYVLINSKYLCSYCGQPKTISQANAVDNDGNFIKYGVNNTTEPTLKCNHNYKYPGGLESDICLLCNASRPKPISNAGLRTPDVTPPQPEQAGKIEPLKGDWITDSQALSKLIVKIDEIIAHLNRTGRE